LAGKTLSTATKNRRMGVDLGVKNGAKDSKLGLDEDVDQPDPEAVLLETHREKCDTRFNGILRLDYHEGNLRKIKEEVTIRDLSKKI